MTTGKKDTRSARLPTKAEILTYIQKAPSRVGKRDITRAFKVRGADRPAFKMILKELEQDGVIGRGDKRRYAESGRLPEVAVVDAIKTDSEGDLIGQPAGWE